MTERDKRQKIEKRSPEGRRWVVVSSAEVAIRALAKMGLENPSSSTIRALIIKAKSNQRIWEMFQQRAHEFRCDEMAVLIKGLTKQEQIDTALVKINQKYAEINEDPSRNFSYLDDIVLGSDVDEGKKAAS